MGFAHAEDHRERHRSGGGDSDVLWSRKTADETVINSSALQDDDHLQLSVAANAVYVVEARVIYTASGGDFKCGFSVPAGATLDWSVHPRWDTALTEGFLVSTNLTEADTNATEDAATQRALLIRGILITGGSSGSLRFRFAQNVASPGQNAAVHRRSYIEAHRRS